MSWSWLTPTACVWRGGPHQLLGPGAPSLLVHVDAKLTEAQQEFSGPHLQGVEGVQRLLGQEGQRRVFGTDQTDGGRLPLQGK